MIRTQVMHSTEVTPTLHRQRTDVAPTMYRRYTHVGVAAQVVRLPPPLVPVLPVAVARVCSNVALHTPSSYTCKGWFIMHA